MEMGWFIYLKIVRVPHSLWKNIWEWPIRSWDITVEIIGAHNISPNSSPHVLRHLQWQGMVPFSYLEVYQTTVPMLPKWFALSGTQLWSCECVSMNEAYMYHLVPQPQLWQPPPIKICILHYVETSSRYVLVSISSSRNEVKIQYEYFNCISWLSRDGVESNLTFICFLIFTGVHFAESDILEERAYHLVTITLYWWLFSATFKQRQILQKRSS